MEVGMFFFAIAWSLVIAAILGSFAKILKQPPLLGYILAGLLLGLFSKSFIASQGTLEEFSTIGITLMLFIVGLNMEIQVIKDLGKSLLVFGILQVLITSICGFALSFLLGIPLWTALLLGVILSLSSTIVVVKSLTDENSLNSLHGKLLIGLMIFQDIVAILVIILLAIESGGDLTFALTFAGIKVVLVLVLITLVSKYIINPYLKFAADSQELLFLVSLAWGMITAYLCGMIGLSLEMGAFLAGISIASLPYSFEITSKIKPLRDLFITIFFIVLGSKIIFPTQINDWVLIIAFWMLAMVLKPIIFISIMKKIGYGWKTSFYSGFTASQLSEFALIVASLAPLLIDAKLGTMLTLATVLSIVSSSYLTKNTSIIYTFAKKTFKLKEGNKIKENILNTAIKSKYDIILIGCKKTGYKILKSFADEMKDHIVIIDFNPRVILSLQKQGYHTHYGDLTDTSIINQIIKYNPLTIVSTIDNPSVNSELLKKASKKLKKTKILITTNVLKDALEMYKKGATYVSIPSFEESEKIISLLDETEQVDKKDEIKKLLELDERERKIITN